MGELPNALIPDPHVPQTEGLQIDDHRLSISCEVVGQPDHHHHCGDNLVLFPWGFKVRTCHIIMSKRPNQRAWPCHRKWSPIGSTVTDRVFDLDFFTTVRYCWLQAFWLQLSFCKQWYVDLDHLRSGRWSKWWPGPPCLFHKESDHSLFCTEKPSPLLVFMFSENGTLNSRFS